MNDQYYWRFSGYKYRCYTPGGTLVQIYRSEEAAQEWVDRYNEKRDNNMNENEQDKRVQSINLGGFVTKVVKLSTGWVGQISGGTDNSAWDSEPFDNKDDALKAANDKLEEKLKAIFA